MSDSERELSVLLREAASSLTPDVPGLVGGAVARGRRKARRSRTGTTLAAVAVVGIVGGMAGPLATGTDTDTVGGGRGSIAATTPSAATGPTDSPGQTAAPQRQLTVAADEIPETFARIFPGEITKLPQKEPGVPIVDFRWNGFAVRVGFTTAEQEAGTSIDPRSGQPIPGSAQTDPGTPMERCLRSAPLREDGSTAPCRRGPRGSVVSTLHRFPTEGGVTTNWAWVFTTDGRTIWVSAANATEAKDGTVLAPHPPLTPQQLLQAATSDLWFE
jgi:hypothetical protein